MSTDPNIEIWQAYLDGELSEEAMRQLDKQIAEDEELRVRFALLQAEYQKTQHLFDAIRELDQSFQVEQQLERLQPHLHAGAQAEKRPQWWAYWLSFAVVVSAVFVVLLVNPWPWGTDGQGSNSNSPPTWIAKGTSLHMLHQHKHRRHSVRTQNGDLLHPGDFVQFTYSMSQPQHVMIVSINEKGVVSRYIPLEQANSLLLQARAGTLPRKAAIELDDSLGAELFLMLVARAPFSYQQVKQALQAAFRKNPQITKGLALQKQPWHIQHSVWIRKTK